MQSIGPLLVFPLLFGVYGIYLAIAAFTSDFVYVLKGYRVGKIEIRAMDSKATRIKTSATGVFWIVAVIFILFIGTQGRIFDKATWIGDGGHPAITKLDVYSLKNAKNSQGIQNGAVFEILRIEPSLGVIRSIAWDESLKKSVQKTDTVQTGPDGDIHAAVVAHLVDFMHEHSDGYVRWNSTRLGRTVMVPMRHEEDATLRRFLTSEFFGT